MKTLHLNLKKKWFDMILSGEKREEYREIKPYWCVMLVLNLPFVIEAFNNYSKYFWMGYLSSANKNKMRENPFTNGVNLKDFDTITFSNGYAKNRRQFVIALGGIHIGTGLKKWGAEKGKKYFVLQLGEILNK